ncbi:MAG: hypothetical protein Q8M83_05785 [bacterium]|nr:hypothetical protein [bacterium]
MNNEQQLGTKATGGFNEITVNLAGLSQKLHTLRPEDIADIAMAPDGSVRICTVRRSAFQGKETVIPTPNGDDYVFLRYLGAVKGNNQTAIACEVSQPKAVKDENFMAMLTTLVKWLLGNKTAAKAKATELILAYRGNAAAFFAEDFRALNFQPIKIGSGVANNIRLRVTKGNVEAFATTNRTLYYFNFGEASAVWKGIYAAEWEIDTLSKLGKAGLLAINYADGYEMVNVGNISPTYLRATIELSVTAPDNAVTGIIAVVPTKRGKGYFVGQKERKTGQMAGFLHAVLVPVTEMLSEMVPFATQELRARGLNV